MRRIVLIFGLVLFFARTGNCDGVDLPFFDQGSKRLSLEAGYGSFNSQGYFILGVGGGYYILKDLEAGVDGEVWMGSSPGIYTLSPRLTYVLPLESRWKPYVGGFYKRTFYSSGFDDLNSAGGRIGVLTPGVARSYLSAGVVFEQYLSCNSAVYGSCSQVYPELGVGLSF